MLVPQKMISATSTALDNYGVVQIPIVISLYNEVRLYWVVHFVIQLLGFSRIQAESDKNRIHTLGILIDIPRSFDQCKRSLL